MFTSTSPVVVCPEWCVGGHQRYDLAPDQIVEHVSRTIYVPGDPYLDLGREHVTLTQTVELIQHTNAEGQSGDVLVELGARMMSPAMARDLAEALLQAVEVATR